MMGAMALRDIAAATGADYQGDILVERICTDSRQLRTGDLYVALVGERFDGNQFAAQAAEAGACAAVLSQRSSAALPQLQVTDTRQALGEISRLNRRAFHGPLVAVTGSAGKTTTKEMMAAIFAVVGPVLATQGNLNNEVGVPLTLLRLAPEHRAAVIEMGAGRPGDIAYLCQFAEPDVGIVTNALAAHIQGFGDVATVARTKGEMFSSLPAHGVAVINADDVRCALWRSMAGERRQMLFGLSATADVRAEEIVPEAAGQSFRLLHAGESVAIRLALLGRHNVVNALAAAAATLAAGATLSQIAEGLANVRAVPGRLHLLRADAGAEVIDDSYNANPSAVRAAVDVLMSRVGRRILVLGDMAELGEQSDRMHREVAEYAADRGVDALWLVGRNARLMADAFGDAARVFADRESLAAALNAETDHQTVILVKGSRSAGMDSIVSALCSGRESVGEAH